jgi:hypothetical protein
MKKPILVKESLRDNSIGLSNTVISGCNTKIQLSDPSVIMLLQLQASLMMKIKLFVYE